MAFLLFYGQKLIGEIKRESDNLTTDLNNNGHGEGVESVSQFNDF